MIMKIVHNLRIAKGTNAKLQILKDNSDNKLWNQILFAMYNTSINYYVSAPTDPDFVDYGHDYSELLGKISYLSTRAVTGSNARVYATGLSQEYGEIARLILGGSLKAGVSIVTINKAYPGLIPTFPMMLANKDVAIKFPILSSTKYDGVRIAIFVGDLGAIIYTRSGKELDIVSLKQAIRGCPEGVYDGELILGDGLQSERTKISGFVNRILKGSLSDIPKEYKFMVFDHLTLLEWDLKVCERDFLSRLHRLNEIEFDDRYIRSIPQEELTDQDQIDSLYRDIYSKGYEGLILRYTDDPYVWKRSDMLIKIKATHSCVLLCIDTTEGTGKYEGMIGALWCEGVVDGKFVKTKVGTGLSDFDRDKDSSYYIDSDIDVSYNDIVKAKNSDYYSLFLPVFKRIKGDHNV